MHFKIITLKMLLIAMAVAISMNMGIKLKLYGMVTRQSQDLRLISITPQYPDLLMGA